MGLLTTANIRVYECDALLKRQDDSMNKREAGYNPMFGSRESIIDAIEYLNQTVACSEPPAIEHLAGFMVVINTMAIEIERLSECRHVL